MLNFVILQLNFTLNYVGCKMVLLSNYRCTVRPVLRGYLWENEKLAL